MFSGANPTTPKNSLSGDKRHDLLQSAKVCSCVRECLLVVLCMGMVQTFLLNLGLMPLRLVFSPDGRDHVPCCIREQVPDICQDLCRGEYTVVTDNVKTHFSCPTYIERTLSCIADGIGKSTNNTINFPNHPNKLLLHQKCFGYTKKIIKINITPT